MFPFSRWHVLLVVFISGCTTTGPDKQEVREMKGNEACKIPAHPINWVLKFCMSVEGTNDEIAIQNGECFKSAKPDLESAESPCKVKEKYKTKYCGRHVKQYKKHKSVRACVKDRRIRPFFAGG